MCCSVSCNPLVKWAVIHEYNSTVNCNRTSIDLILLNAVTIHDIQDVELAHSISQV